MSDDFETPVEIVVDKPDMVTTKDGREMPRDSQDLTIVTNADQTASLHSMFSIVNPTTEEADMLKVVQEHFKDRNDVDTIVGVRSIENRVGAPKMGETRLSRVYQYIKANQQVQEAEKLRDSLLGD